MSFIKSRAYALFNQRVPSKEFTPIGRRTESTSRAKSGSVDPNKSFDNWQSMNMPSPYETSTGKMSSLVSKEPPFRIEKRQSDVSSVKEDFLGDETLKDPTEEDLLELASRKICSYLEVVKQFEASASELVGKISGVIPEVEDILKDFQEKKASLDDFSHQMERTVLKLGFTSKTRKNFLNTSLYSQNSPTKGSRGGIYDSSPGHNISGEGSLQLNYFDIDIKYKDLGTQDVGTKNPDLENLQQMVSYLEKKNNLLLNRLQTASVRPKSKLEFSVASAGLPRPPTMARKTSQEPENKRSGSIKLRIPLEEEQSPIRRKMEPLYKELKNMKTKVSILETEKINLMQENIKLREELCSMLEESKKQKTKFGNVRKELNTLQAERSKLKLNLDKTTNLYEGEKHMSAQLKSTIKTNTSRPLPRGKSPVSLKHSQSNPNPNPIPNPSPYPYPHLDHKLIMDELKDMLKTKYSGIYERLQQKENELDMIGDLLKEKLRGLDATTLMTEGRDETIHLPKSARENENETYLQSSNSLAELMNDINQLKILKQESEEKSQLDKSPTEVLRPQGTNGEPRSPLKVYKGEINMVGDKNPGEFRRVAHKQKSISKPKTPANVEAGRLSEERKSHGPPKVDFKNTLDLSGISGFKGSSEKGGNTSRELGSMSARDFTKNSFADEVREVTMLNETQKKYTQMQKSLNAQVKAYKNLEIEKLELENRLDLQKKEASRIEAMYSEQIQFLNGVVEELKVSIQVLTDRLNTYEKNESSQIETKVEGGSTTNFEARLNVKERELEETKSELARKMREIEALEKSLIVIKQELSQKELHLQDIETHQNKSISILSDENSKEQKMNEERLKVIMMENEILGNEIDSLRKSNQELNEKKDKYAKEFEKIKTQQKQVEEDLSKKNKELTQQTLNLTADAEKLNQNIESLSKDLEAKKVEMEAVKKTLKENAEEHEKNKKLIFEKAWTLKEKFFVSLNSEHEKESSETNVEDLLENIENVYDKWVQKIHEERTHLASKDQTAKEILEKIEEQNKKDVEELKREINHLKSLLTDKEKELESYKENYEKNLEEMKSNERTLRESQKLDQGRLEELNKLVESLNTNLAEREHKDQERIKNHEEEIAAVSQEIDLLNIALSEKKKESEKNSKKYEEEIESLKRGKDQLQQELLDKNKENKSAKSKYAEDLEVLSTQIVSLQQELVSKQREIDENKRLSEDKIESLNQEIGLISRTLSGNTSQFDEERKVYEDKIVVHLQEIDKASEKLANYQEKIENLSCELDLLRSNNSDIIKIKDEQIKQSEIQIESLKVDIESLSRKLSEKEEQELQDKKSYNDNSILKEKELSEWRQKVESIEKKEKENQLIFNENLEKLRAEIDSLSHNLQEKEREITGIKEKYQHKVEQLQENINSLSKQLQDKETEAEKQKGSHEKNIEKLKSEVESHKKTIHEQHNQKEAQEKSSKEELERMTKDIEMLEQKVRQLEDEREETHQANEHKLHDLTHQLEKATKDLENKKKHSEQEVKSLKEEIHLLSENSSNLMQALETTKRELLLNLIFKLREILGSEDNTEVKEDADIELLRQEIESLVERSLAELDNQQLKSLEEKEEQIKELKHKYEEKSKEREKAHVEKENMLAKEIEELKKILQDKDALYEDEVAKISFGGLIQTINVLNRALKIQEFVSEPAEIQSSDIEALNEKINVLSDQIVAQFEEKDKRIEEVNASLENLKIQNEEKIKLFEQDIERQCQQIQELNQSLIIQKREIDIQIEETKRNELISFAEKLVSTFKHGEINQNKTSDMHLLKAEIECILDQEVSEKQHKEESLHSKSQEITGLNQKLETIMNDMKKKETESERDQQAFLEKIKRLEHTILDNEKEHERLREKAVFEELDKVAQMFQSFISQLENQDVQKKEEERANTYDVEAVRKKIKGLCRSLILQVELKKEEHSEVKGNEIQEIQTRLENVIMQSEAKEEGYLQEIEKLKNNISSLKEENTKVLEGELKDFVSKLEQVIKQRSQETEEKPSEGVSNTNFLRNRIEVLLALWISQVHEKEQEWTQKEMSMKENYSTLEGKFKSLEEDRDSLANKSAALEQELNSVKAEHTQRASDIVDKEKTLEALRISLEEKIYSLENELENYKKQIEDKDSTYKSLEEQLQSSQNAKEEVVKETDDLKQKLVKAEEELQESINKVQRVETFRETLVQTLEKAEHEKQHLVQELQTSVHEQISLRTDLDSKNQALQEAQEEIVKRLQEQEENKKQLKEEYEKLLNERNLEFETLTKESLQLEREFEDNINSMREEITRELEKKLKHVEGELAEMVLSKSQIQSELEDKEKSMKALEEKLDSVTRENEMLNSQIQEIDSSTLAKSQLIEEFESRERVQEDVIHKLNESFSQLKNIHEESFQSRHRELEEEIKSHHEEKQKLEEDLRRERELRETKVKESSESAKVWSDEKKSLEDKIKELEVQIKNLTEHGEGESQPKVSIELKEKLDILENICFLLLEDDQKSEPWKTRVANMEARISTLLEKEKEETKATNLNQVIELQKVRISKLQEMLEDRFRMLQNEGLNEDISEFLTSNALEESFERTSERMSSRIQEELEKSLTVECTFEYQGQIWCVISNNGDKGKDQRFFIKSQKEIESSFLGKDLAGKKLVKSDGLKEQIGIFLDNLVQATYNQTRTIYKGVQNSSISYMGDRSSLIFKEILESNEKLWTRIEEINTLDPKGEDFFKMTANSLNLTSKAREENQKAIFLCSDLERNMGEGSPASLRLARMRSGREDYSINVHEMRPSSVSGSVNRLDNSMLENPMATFGDLEEQLSQKELALRSYESKIDQLNTSHQKIAEENAFIKKNMDSTIRVQGELRIANDKFKSQNDLLMEELKDRETDEQRFILQIQILKKELEECRTKIAQMESTHEKEHLKKILMKFMDGFLKGDQNKETPELLKIICSLVFCTENEKARLLDLLNKQLSQKNKGLLKMFA